MILVLVMEVNEGSFYKEDNLVGVGNVLGTLQFVEIFQINFYLVYI